MRLIRSVLSLALLASLSGCPGPDPVDASDTGADTAQPDTGADTTAPDTGADTAEPDTTEPDTAEPDTTEPDTTEPDTTEPDTTEPDTLADTTEPDTVADTIAPDTTEPDTLAPDTLADTAEPDTAVPTPSGETCADPFVAAALPYTLTVDTSAFADDLSTGGACGLGGDRGAGSGDVVVAFTAPATGLYRWAKAAHGGPALITAAAACDGPALSGCDATSGDLWAGGAWTFWRDAGQATRFAIDGWFPGDHGPATLILEALDATACDTYCGLVTSACVGPHTQYTSYAHCLDYCQTWAALPPGDPAAPPANTVACRAHQAALAGPAPAPHCPAAGPTGADVCGSPCDAYCKLYAANCAGLAPAFADTPACLTACAALDASGPPVATAGDTLQCRLYHLAVAGADPAAAADHCASGAIDGGATCGAVAPPAGATCAAPIPIASVPYLHLGATLDAGADAAFSDAACPGTPSGRGAASSDRVYAFTPTLAGRYRVAIADADFDTALYAATTCDDVDASCLGAADVAGSGGERLILELAAGAPVFLFVDGWSDSEDVSGHYRLTVERLDPTDCATYCAAVTAACTGPDAQYASLASCLTTCADTPPGLEGAAPADTVACRAAEAALAADDPSHCPAAGPSGGATCGTACEAYCRLAAATCAIYDTDAACLSACDAFPHEGAPGDTAGDSVQCRLTQALAAAADPARCLAAAAASPTCQPPPAGTGDSCADPVPVTAFPFVYTGSPGASADAGLTGCDGAAIGPDFVFAVTAPVAGVYPLTLEGGPFDRLYTLDAACSPASCTERERLVLAAGETAYVVLDATSPIIASNELTLEIGAPAPTSCGDWCALYTEACAPLSPYETEDDCVDACLAAARPPGTTADRAVDSIACRAHHAGRALSGDLSACVAAGPDGGGVCGSFCDAYCHLATTACLGDAQIFASRAACDAVCPLLPLVGSPGDLVGDSLFCRTTYLAAPQVGLPGQGSGVDRCLAGGVTGGPVCVGPVPGDTCADPVVVDAVPFYLPGDTAWWSDDTSTGGACGDPADRGADTGDLVLRFRPATSGDYRWTKLGAGGPSMLQLATDCADLAASCLGLSGDLWSGGAWTVSLTADTDYYFVLDGWLPEDEGPFSLLLEATP